MITLYLLTDLLIHKIWHNSFTHYVSFDCQVLLKMTHVASEYEEVAKNNHDMECIMKEPLHKNSAYAHIVLSYCLYKIFMCFSGSYQLKILRNYLNRICMFNVTTIICSNYPFNYTIRVTGHFQLRTIKSI